MQNSYITVHEEACTTQVVNNKKKMLHESQPNLKLSEFNDKNDDVRDDCNV